MNKGILVELPDAYTFGMNLRVNKTSLICIIIGLINAMLPMADINVAIFGDHEEKIDPRSFSEVEEGECGFTTVIFSFNNMSLKKLIFFIGLR